MALKGKLQIFAFVFAIAHRAESNLTSLFHVEVCIFVTIMKIICVGYWKTGTKSMTKALTTLGYNVYDFEEQIMYLKHLWDKFFDGTVTDQDIYEAFKDVDVIIDGPTVAFWSEIYKVFPEAKVSSFVKLERMVHFDDAF